MRNIWGIYLFKEETATASSYISETPGVCRRTTVACTPTLFFFGLLESASLHPNYEKQFWVTWIVHTGFP